MSRYIVKKLESIYKNYYQKGFIIEMLKIQLIIEYEVGSVNIEYKKFEAQIYKV